LVRATVRAARVVLRFLDPPRVEIDGGERVVAQHDLDVVVADVAPPDAKRLQCGGLGLLVSPLAPAQAGERPQIPGHVGVILAVRAAVDRQRPLQQGLGLVVPVEIQIEGRDVEQRRRRRRVDLAVDGLPDLEGGQRQPLGPEAGEDLVACRSAAEHLDCHLLVEVFAFGEIYRAHPAVADQAHDAIGADTFGHAPALQLVERLGDGPADSPGQVEGLVGGDRQESPEFPGEILVRATGAAYECLPFACGQRQRFVEERTQSRARGRRRRSFQARAEPGLGESQILGQRRPGHGHRFGGLVIREATEIDEFHRVRRPLLQRREPAERVVERQQVNFGRRFADARFVEGQDRAGAAALGPGPRPGVVHEDAAHHSGGQGKEVAAVADLDPGVGQLEPRLVHERGGLKGVGTPLAPHGQPGLTPELIVELRRHVLHGGAIPALPGIQQRCQFPSTVQL
jgi:hypothetical protein